MMCCVSDEEQEVGEEEGEQGSDSRHDNPWLSKSGEEIRVLLSTYLRMSYVCTYVGQSTTDERDKVHGSLSSKRAGLQGSRGVIDTGSYIVAEGGEGLGAASKQLLAVREAFAGDNVVEEFEREKAELESREMQVDAPVILPGVYMCVFTCIHVYVCVCTMCMFTCVQIWLFSFSPKNRGL